MRRTSLNFCLSSRRPSPLDLRRQHSNLHQTGMHSSLLSEHILTQRAARDEEAWRRKKTAEYQEVNLPVGAATNAPPVSTKESSQQGSGSFWDMRSEYYAIMLTALTGAVSGFVFADFLLQSEPVRLPYDPVHGFLHDVEVHEKRAQMVQQYVSEKMWKDVGWKKPKSSSWW